MQRLETLKLVTLCMIIIMPPKTYGCRARLWKFLEPPCTQFCWTMGGMFASMQTKWITSWQLHHIEHLDPDDSLEMRIPQMHEESNVGDQRSKETNVTSLSGGQPPGYWSWTRYVWYPRYAKYEQQWMILPFRWDVQAGLGTLQTIMVISDWFIVYG